MTRNIWDDFEPVDDSGGGDRYVKFTEVGDHVEGVITEIVAHSFNDGDPLRPSITVTTPRGEVREFRASQINLFGQLRRLQPAIGDFISVTFAGEKRTAAGLKAKQFTVTHRPIVDRPNA